MEPWKPVTMDCDSVFIAPGVVGPRIKQFVDELWAQWPDMLVWLYGTDHELLDGEEELREWRTCRDLLPRDAGGVYMIRDSEMDAFTDEHAYAIDEHGEGPIYLLWDACSRETFRVTLDEDPWRRDLGLGWDPYQVVVASAGMSLVTAVTPDDDDPWVKSQLARLVEVLNRPEA